MLAPTVTDPFTPAFVPDVVDVPCVSELPSLKVHYQLSPSFVEKLKSLESDVFELFVSDSDMVSDSDIELDITVFSVSATFNPSDRVVSIV